MNFIVISFTYPFLQINETYIISKINISKLNPAFFKGYFHLFILFICYTPIQIAHFKTIIHFLKEHESTNQVTVNKCFGIHFIDLDITFFNIIDLT